MGLRISDAVPQLALVENRRETAEKASVPSLLHTGGPTDIFLWSSDPAPFSKGNERMWLSDLKAIMWSLFYKGAERLKGRTVQEMRSPLPEYQHPAVLGDTDPPREGGLPRWAWAKTEYCQPKWGEYRVFTISSSFSSLLHTYTSVKTYQEFHSILRHYTRERKSSDWPRINVVSFNNCI